MTALPPSLDRFGGELENAVGRDLRRRHTRRRVVRGAAVLAVAGAVALGLLNGLTGGGPSVVQRAAAALESDGGILHYRMDAEQQNGDGTSVTWHSETWQLRVDPFTRRQIEVGSDGISRSRLERLTGSTHVSAAYVMRNGAGAVKVIATAQGAKRLRRQVARERARESSGPGVDSSAPGYSLCSIRAVSGSPAMSRSTAATQSGSSRSRERRSTSWTPRPTTRSSGRRRGTAGA
jgi:hypothetical protein